MRVSNPENPDLLVPLFNAMENHGNKEGTETQMDDAEEFLRLAFDMLPAAKKQQFLRKRQVTSFIKREGGDDES